MLNWICWSMRIRGAHQEQKALAWAIWYREGSGVTTAMVATVDSYSFGPPGEEHWAIKIWTRKALLCTLLLVNGNRRNKYWYWYSDTKTCCSCDILFLVSLLFLIFASRGRCRHRSTQLPRQLFYLTSWLLSWTRLAIYYYLLCCLWVHYMVHTYVSVWILKIH